MDRTKEIIALRKSGLTLEKIGAKFNITKERVRQILFKTDTPKRFLKSLEGICKKCGENFNYYPSQKIKKRGVFCSRECWEKRKRKL